MTKLYGKFSPVGETLWLEYDRNAALRGTNLVLPGQGMKMPPFVECKVLAIGPDVKQVKAGDTVLLNSGTITGMKPGATEYFFTMEKQVVAIDNEPEVGNPISESSATEIPFALPGKN